MNAGQTTHINITKAKGGLKKNMANNSNNEILVQNARAALEQLKQETASELGITNYQQQYKGDLPSRVNGSVGGYMTKKMIALAQQQLAGGAQAPK
jgi:small acid-soluble spore protein A (major alpha-type SASP)